MRLGFNANYLTSSATRGISRYSLSLLSELCLDSRIEKILLFSNSPVHPDHMELLQHAKFQNIFSGKINYMKWEYGWLPKKVKEEKVNIFHAPHNYGLNFRILCPKVLTCHDLIDWKFLNKRMSLVEKLAPAALLYRMIHKQAKTSVDKVITVSEYSKKDVLDLYKISKDDVHVIYESYSKIFDHHCSDDWLSHIKEKFSLPTDYIFYVGGFEERKNLGFLLRAVSEIPDKKIPIVLAGGGDSTHLKELAAQYQISDRVSFLGFVTDEELNALYRLALCFVYPSLYEGFGLQTCESMACGCPTLVSNLTSLPEVIGDGGLTFSLEETTELKEILVKLVEHDSFRHQLSEKARLRANSFSWEKTARETIDVYEELLGANGPAQK